MAEESSLLQPGQMLVRPLRDPGSRAIFLPAGTVLSQKLIQRLRRASLEEACLACVGAPPWGRLPEPRAELARRQLARRPTGGLEDLFQSPQVIQADRALWTLMLLILAGAAATALLTGDGRLLDLAVGALAILGVALLFQFWAAAEVRRRVRIRERFLQDA